MATVTATHTIARQGSGATCTFGNGPPPPPSRWGHHGGSSTADCSRTGGLTAVGSGGQTCACCAVGPPGGAPVVAPAPIAPAVCPAGPSGRPPRPAPAPAPGGAISAAPTAGCETDVDSSGNVGVSDLLLILGAFGYNDVCGQTAPAQVVACDVNADCSVGVGDILLTLGMFGAICTGSG